MLRRVLFKGKEVKVVQIMPVDDLGPGTQVDGGKVGPRQRRIHRRLLFLRAGRLLHDLQDVDFVAVANVLEQ